MNYCLIILMMLLSLIILPGIIQALNLADVPCGNIGSSTRRIHQRIMGGAVGDIEDFPYAVSIKKYGKHHCGGSLVSHVYLLQIKGWQIILRQSGKYIDFCGGDSSKTALFALELHSCVPPERCSPTKKF